MTTLTNDDPVVISDLTAGGYVSIIHTAGIQIEERLSASPETWYQIYRSTNGGKIDIHALATGVIRITRTTAVATSYRITPAA